VLKDSTRREIKAAACHAPRASFAFHISFRKIAPGDSIRRAASTTAHNARRATIRTREPRSASCAQQDRIVQPSVTHSPAFRYLVRLGIFHWQEQVCVPPARPGHTHGATQVPAPPVLKACSADLDWGLCPVQQERFVWPIALLATLARLDSLPMPRARLLAFRARKGHSVKVQDRWNRRHVQRAGSRVRLSQIAQHALLALTRAATRQVVCPAQLALSVVVHQLSQQFATRAPLHRPAPPGAPSVPLVITRMQGRLFAVPARPACAVRAVISQHLACLEHLPQPMPQRARHVLQARTQMPADQIDVCHVLPGTPAWTQRYRVCVTLDTIRRVTNKAALLAQLASTVTSGGARRVCRAQLVAIAQEMPLISPSFASQASFLWPGLAAASVATMGRFPREALTYAHRARLAITVRLVWVRFYVQQAFLRERKV